MCIKSRPCAFERYSGASRVHISEVNFTVDVIKSTRISGLILN